MALVLPSRRDMAAQVRTYLLRQNSDLGNRNNIQRIFKVTQSHDAVAIMLGPQFDKGPNDSQFQLESGARLSCGVELRENNGRCSLLAYRFQLNLPEGHRPSFSR